MFDFAKRSTSEIQEAKKALQLLQDADEQLLSIANKRGDLPILLEQLRKEIVDLEDKLSISKQRSEEHQQAITTQQEKMKEYQDLADKYEIEKNEANNSQAYDVASKELEITKLDIALAQKKIKEYRHIIAVEQQKIQDVGVEITQKKERLKTKVAILEKINQENQEKETAIHQKKTKITNKLDPAIYAFYESIQKNRGIATAKVVDRACSRCCLIVPDQIQLKIKQNTNLITCQYCHRIFIEVIAPEPVVKPIKKRKRKST